MAHDERCIDRTTCEMMIDARDQSISQQAKIIAELRAELETRTAWRLTAALRKAVAQRDELLAACQEALSDMERWQRMGTGSKPLGDTATMAQLRAAIAKAEVTTCG